MGYFPPKIMPLSTAKPEQSFHLLTIPLQEVAISAASIEYLLRRRRSTMNRFTAAGRSEDGETVFGNASFHMWDNFGECWWQIWESYSS